MKRLDVAHMHVIYQLKGLVNKMTTNVNRCGIELYGCISVLNQPSEPLPWYTLYSTDEMYFCSNAYCFDIDPC